MTTSSSWLKEALKQYFINRPGIRVDTVDLLDYFHIGSVLGAVEELIQEGWLIRSNEPYPKLYQL